MNLPLLRCKYQERYAGYSNPEGVGQFYNTAQRERCSYLSSDNHDFSPSALSPHELCSLVITALYKMITDKSQTKPTTERLNIN